MHSRGWAHYDLKPANVLAFSEGGGRVVARVCDFGAARRFDAPSGLADTGNRLLCALPSMKHWELRSA
jgi:serine/threonine protein kinase